MNGDHSLHSMALFRALFDGSRDAMLLTGDDGRCVDANPAAAALFGASPAALVGRRAPEFGGPDLATEAGSGAPRAFTLQRPDGVARDFELGVTASVLPGVHLSVLRDVTEVRELARERERTLASLAFERGRVGTLLQRVPAFMAVSRGRDHVFELANDAYYALVGKRDLLGRTLAEALPEIAAQCGATMDAVLRDGEAYVALGDSVRVMRRPGEEGEVRLVNVMFQAVVEADGTRSGIFVHGVDVTDETLLQRRVRAQFNGIPMPTFVWQRGARRDARGPVLVDFNDAAVKASRGGINAALGMTAGEFFQADVGMIADLQRCLDTGETFQREMDRTLRGSGETRRLLVTYASGPPDLVLAHTEDVTERRGLEEQFRQAQKMEAVGRLAGGIAHDFNNLLSVILSYCGFVIDDLSPADPMRADLEEVQRAGERAVELTRQLLAFSRQQVLQPRRINLNVALAGVQKMLHRVLGEDIELSLLTAREIAEVFADPGQIEQVIMNLVVNARDAMPRGGRLTIETMNVELDGGPTSSGTELAAGPYVLVAVTDTGVGMDEATRARIFEPFFTTKGPAQGTGLGLSTVFGIVHQSGGEVSVDSELGRGTSFRVYLPCAPRSISVAPAAIPRGATRGGAETVLLVEDEDAVRVLARTILRRGGYRVLEAQNGGEAFLICEQFPEGIDLLITDVVMPRMSGRQLAERLGQTRPTLRVLYMSGYTSDTVLQHGVLEGGVAFLQKPLTPEPLLREVRAALDAPPPPSARL